jgi:hypothetical protein
MMNILAAIAFLVTPADEAPATFWDADLRPPAVFVDKDDDKSRRGFAIGSMGGYLEAQDADRGTWFVGVQARLYFLKFLAAEASISFHQSALVIPFPNASLRPYLVAGLGWYYTSIEYSGVFGGFGL